MCRQQLIVTNQILLVGGPKNRDGSKSVLVSPSKCCIGSKSALVSPSKGCIVWVLNYDLKKSQAVVGSGTK